MTRLAILCEGQTEQAFANRLIVPELSTLGLSAQCMCVETSRNLLTGRQHKGGHGHDYEKVRDNVIKLFRSRFDRVTTMLDYYGLPSNFPGVDAKKTAWTKAHDKVIALEKAFAADVQDERFIPNLVLHEFEGLLFTDPAALDKVIGGRPRAGDVQKVKQAFLSPEEINDSPQTAPSKRLKLLYPEYNKVLHGPQIAEATGLAAIEQACPHFKSWVDRLRALGHA